MKKNNVRAILPALLLVGFTFGMGSCTKDDLDDIRKELQEHNERLTALEEWQKSVNTDIQSMQSLIEALEDKDYVTGVTPLNDETGYVISFQKSGDITIKHGEKGDDGNTPVISVRQDTDGKYYWTVNGEWLLDGGNKMPVTGDKGTDAIAPQVRINTDTNEWEISTDGGIAWTSTGVKATGDEGEQGPVGPSGAACGISDIRIDGSNVIFTWGTGQDAQQITVPLCTPVLTFNDLNEITKGNNTFSTESDLFTRTDLVIQVRVESKSADGTDILTRSASDRWSIGTSISGSTLEITVDPAKETVLNEVALLKVTVTSEEGQQLAYGQKVFTNGIFTGRLSVSSFEDMMAQLDKADKTEATDIIIDGNLENDITVNQMMEFVAEINSFDKVGTLEISVPEINILAYLDFQDQENPKVFKSEYIATTGSNGITFKRSGVEEVYLPNLVSLKQQEFQECKNLRKVYLPGLTEIQGSQVFYSCTALEALDLPNLTTIGSTSYANFARNCYSLKEVNLPKATSLPASAFHSCYSLTHLDFPEVAELGTYAFAECRNLTSVSLPNVTVLPESTFKGCIWLNAEKGFSNVETIKEYAFTGCSAITKAVFPKATTIERFVFEGCRNLNALTLGAVSSVVASAFDDIDTESCTLTFKGGEPTAGDLDKEQKTWCGKKWKSIAIQ